MKKKLLYIAIFIATLNSYAQITFEKGYFITNSDERIECLIKNEDWQYNPTEFSYKTDISSLEKTNTIKNIKEFGIYNISKFHRAKVQIDRSSDLIKKMSTERKPSFTTEELFLKILIEGEVNLYSYNDINLYRFFYSKNKEQIEQLIYKKYTFSDRYKIGVNERYKQQLLKVLSCNNISNTDIEKLNYKKNSLIKILIKYNKCINSKYVVANETKRNSKIKFNITPKLGIGFSSFTLNENFRSKSFELDQKKSFRFGVDFEYILNFNKNKWGIFINPTYQSSSSSKTFFAEDVSGGLLNIDISYTSIELPIGLRHYMFLDKKSKIYMDFSYNLGYNLDSNVTLKRDDSSTFRDYDIEPGNTFSFGLGYKYNNKYLIGFSVLFPRNITDQYRVATTDFSNISISFGYTIL